MSQQPVLPRQRTVSKFLIGLAGTGFAIGLARGEPAPPAAIAKPDASPVAAARPEPLPTVLAKTDTPPVLSVGEAVQWALQHNPDLITVRQQHGIAAAAVVIARTYPFNPVAQTFVLGDGGPSSAGITNRVFVEQTMRLDLEVRGQGKFRRSAASAALTRTDWDIATQELTLAIRVVRACNTLAYRRDKLRLLDEAAVLQRQSADQMDKLVEQGKANRVDLVLARADLAEAATARAPAQAQYLTALYDLRRLLGLVDEPLGGVSATLEPSVPTPDDGNVVPAALARRPEVQALQMAVQEAEARMKFEKANRFGNPSIGPGFEYNETSVTFVGLWAYYPIPVLNTRRGEILQRQAERERALSALQAIEVQVQQDVKAALARLANAEQVVDAFRNTTLPALREALLGIDRLLAQGEPGADVGRAVEVRRRLLRARDLYLDALFELNQACADLAFAMGDPTLAFAPSPAPH